jgi:hypothetical protein
MRVDYPKQPVQIRIRETRFDTDLGITLRTKAPVEITLKEKLDEYFLRLGYSNLYVLNIMIQLFTLGKVRVEFSTFIERLELLNPSDMLSSAQAVSLLDDYVLTIKDLVTPGPSTSTAKIVVHRPNPPPKE